MMDDDPTLIDDIPHQLTLGSIEADPPANPQRADSELPTVELPENIWNSLGGGDQVDECTGEVDLDEVLDVYRVINRIDASILDKEDNDAEMSEYLGQFREIVGETRWKDLNFRNRARRLDNQRTTTLTSIQKDVFEGYSMDRPEPLLRTPLYILLAHGLVSDGALSTVRDM